MSDKEKVEAIIDSNEASQKPELVQKIALHEDVVDYRINPDIEGDIAIGNCLFERKTPSDFASSLEEGRLRDQVERMAGTEKVPFILVDGNMEDFDSLSHTNIDSKSLRGMDASIEMRNGVGVKYCSSVGNVADMAVRLARKEKEDLTSVQVRQTDAVKDASFMEQVFLAVDGVGVKTAEKLSAEFECLSDALEATQNEFEQVDDVGSTTSEEIYSEFHNRDNTVKSDHSEDKRVYEI